MAKIYLTFDYEVFLGENSGGIIDCLIEPTKLISKVLSENDVYATFFIDFGYLLSIENTNDELIILSQLKDLIHAGNVIQLHIHPHWFSKKSNKFYISDYPVAEIESFIDMAIDYALRKLDIRLSSYRAGGLNTKTLHLYENYLSNRGIMSDSSSLDIDSLSLKLMKQFKISTIYYSPIFYFKLIYNRYVQKSKINRFGKGNSKSMPLIQKIKRLIFGVKDHVSFDSNKWNLLENKVINKAQFVILNHPKSMNYESIKALNKFIKLNSLMNTFDVIK